MTTTQAEAIRRHGLNLLAVFPAAAETDPIKLCKRLRRYEAEAAAIGLRMCNGPEYAEGEADELGEAILGKVNVLLGNDDTVKVPIFINRDPRGYALKVDDEWQREQKKAGKPYIGHEDWGGYGIIAPEIK